jgi:hypothetical protein
VRRWAAFLCLTALPGCVPTSGPALGCGAERLQSLVGQPLSALDAARPDGDYKVDYPLPDGSVTLEEISDRLRVTVDERGTILQVGCG